MNYDTDFSEIPSYLDTGEEATQTDHVILEPLQISQLGENKRKLMLSDFLHTANYMTTQYGIEIL